MSARNLIDQIEATLREAAHGWYEEIWVEPEGGELEKVWGLLGKLEKAVADAGEPEYVPPGERPFAIFAGFSQVAEYAKARASA